MQNELDQAQQSDPSLEEFLNGLGEEAGVSTEAEDGTMLTASEECNVRAEASTDADILGVISAGDQVQKTGTDGEWVQIDLRRSDRIHQRRFTRIKLNMERKKYRQLSLW